MKASHTLMAILFIVSAATNAQVVPAATGPAGLPVSGTLRYNLRYSQTAEFGGYQDGQQRIFASGDASYANLRKRFPFSLQYGGGYGWVLAGPSAAGNLFQHLSLSQGIVGRAWSLTASDNVSYTFETPTTGFSGVPGTGEPVGGSGSTTPTDQTVVSLNTRTLDQIMKLGFGDRLNHAWSLNVDFSSGQLLYIDNNGQNTNMLMADAGITRRLNARNSVSGQYSFSRYSYGASALTNAAQLSFSQVNTAQFSFKRQWNRQISTSASVGPQWVSSSNSAIEPSSTRFSLNASAIDSFRVGTASLYYSHGTTGGSGYMLGAESDVLGASFSRAFGKKLTIGATSSYMRTAGLVNNGVTNATYGGAQATRRLGRNFNIFANYTAINQSSNLQNSANVLNSLSQVIGFGIGYSPRETHLKK